MKKSILFADEPKPENASCKTDTYWFFIFVSCCATKSTVVLFTADFNLAPTTVSTLTTTDKK